LLLGLPEEMLLMFLWWLKTRELVPVSGVCKRLKVLADEVWTARAKGLPAAEEGTGASTPLRRRRGDYRLLRTVTLDQKIGNKTLVCVTNDGRQVAYLSDLWVLDLAIVQDGHVTHAGMLEFGRVGVITTLYALFYDAHNRLCAVWTGRNNATLQRSMAITTQSGDTAYECDLTTSERLVNPPGPRLYHDGFLVLPLARNRHLAFEQLADGSFRRMDNPQPALDAFRGVKHWLRRPMFNNKVSYTVHAGVTIPRFEEYYDTTYPRSVDQHDRLYVAVDQRLYVLG
jgi:hypothetical protein